MDAKPRKHRRRLDPIHIDDDDAEIIDEGIATCRAVEVQVPASRRWREADTLSMSTDRVTSRRRRRHHEAAANMDSKAQGYEEDEEDRTTDRHTRSRSPATWPPSTHATGVLKWWTRNITTPKVSS